MKTWLILVSGLVMSGLFVPAASAAEWSATLHWARRVELTTPVSGRVDAVLVQSGARVDKGQPLLRLDDRPFKAEIVKAQADVARTKDAYDEAKRELDRAQELYDRTVYSVHDLQLAKIAHTSAQSHYRSAQARLTEARLKLEYSVIKAPFNARVVEQRAEEGETVVTRLQATPLLVIADADRMLARAAVSEDQLSGLKQGQAMQVRVGDRTYDGKIVRIGLEPTAEQGGTTLYPMDVEFPLRGDEELRAGQKATISSP